MTTQLLCELGLNISQIVGNKYIKVSSYEHYYMKKIKNNSSFLLQYIEYLDSDDILNFNGIVEDKRIKNNSFFKEILKFTQPVREEDIENKWNEIKNPIRQRLYLIYKIINNNN